MRFALTAQTLARDAALKRTSTPLTAKNKAKVLKYRGEAGVEELANMVRRFTIMDKYNIEGRRARRPQKIMLPNHGRKEGYYMRPGDFTGRSNYERYNM